MLGGGGDFLACAGDGCDGGAGGVGGDRERECRGGWDEIGVLGSSFIWLMAF